MGFGRKYYLRIITRFVFNVHTRTYIVLVRMSIYILVRKYNSDPASLSESFMGNNTFLEEWIQSSTQRKCSDIIFPAESLFLPRFADAESEFESTIKDRAREKGINRFP